ncbi:MAG: GTPase Era [Oligoflexia bacterium]|nr:GTPase Era [Oligoflexia bacterium]
MTTRAGFVAIVGRPNVGKSTLLNSILGTQVSIVTDKAQTTRERVLGILTTEQKQIVFIDTPGIHRAKEGGINAFMMQEAREAIEGASLIWYLVDPASALKHEQAVIELLSKSTIPVFLLLNKTDLISGANNRARLGAFGSDIEKSLEEHGIKVAKSFSLSAIKHKGVDELLEETWKYIPESPLYYPDEEMISDRPMRFFAGEKIREQLFLQLGQELPYSCAVEIEKYADPDPKRDKGKNLTRIEAVIHVERESQKGMVIGKGGQKIKEIGQAARSTIEDFIGGKVFLGLRVDVLKDWSKDEQALRQMGYHLPKGRSS